MNSIKINILKYFFKAKYGIEKNKYYIAFSLCVTDCILVILSKLYQKDQTISNGYSLSSSIVFALLYFLIFVNEKKEFPRNIITSVIYFTIAALLMLFSPYILQCKPTEQVILISSWLLIFIFAFIKWFVGMIKAISFFLKINHKPFLKNTILILTMIGSIVGPIATSLQSIADFLNEQL